MDWNKLKKQIAQSWLPKDQAKPLERIVYSFMSEQQKAELRAEEQRKAYEVQQAALPPPPPPFDLYSVPLELRFAHTHILADTRGGKSTLIENLILHDLESEYRPTVVVVDSQGDLIKKLLKLDLPDDPLYITPRNPPHINLFQAKDEPSIAAALETLEYLFSGLGLDLSGKMRTLFRPMCRLMFSFDSTLLDVIEFLDNPATYKPQIDRLPEIQRKWFYSKVLGTSGVYKTTREDIGYRVEGLIHSPTFERLLTAKRSSIDFYKELNSRKLILIDTDQEYLASDSVVFGRFFISLILRAALDRARIPQPYRTASFLYVDEAQQYFDANTEKLLTEARKYKLGCILAHQRLNQCKGDLKGAVMGATTIKLATFLSSTDKAEMEREMGLDTPNFRQLGWGISGRPHRFTCHIKGHTFYEHVETKRDVLESRPQRKDIEAFMARNAERLAPKQPSATSANLTPTVDSEDPRAY